MMRERDNRPVVVVERSDSGIGAFVWGALIGAGVALLLAPRSGADTRRLIRARGQELLDAAAEKADDLRDIVTEGYERSKARVEEGLEHARRSLDDRREATRDVVDAGRAAVHSARDELERRLSDARAARGRGNRRQAEDEVEAE